MNDTVHAIRIHQTGGPEALRWEEVPLPAPAPHEVRVRHKAVGLNFIDTYHRSGLYPLKLPAGIGLEGAGVIEAAGAYAEARNLPAAPLLKLPDDVDFESAAAMTLQGLTAAALLRRTYRVQAGDAVLVHAAAGGVGLLLCQWAKALGATVIGTVSTEAKAELARAHGCDHAILYRDRKTGAVIGDLAARVRELTGGTGVAVVYDGVGKDTFMASLDSLARLGMMASFGNASGPAPEFAPLLLAQKGSLFLTRPVLMDYIARRADLEALGDELFAVVGSGKVKVEVRQTWPLSEAAKAHAALEAGETTGSTVLLP